MSENDAAKENHNEETQNVFHGYTMINFQAKLDQELARMRENEEIVNDANEQLDQFHAESEMFQTAQTFLTNSFILLVVVTLMMFMAGISWALFVLGFGSFVLAGVVFILRIKLRKLTNNVKVLRKKINEFDDETDTFWKELWGFETHPRINIVELEDEWSFFEDVDTKKQYRIEIVSNDKDTEGETITVGIVDEGSTVMKQLEEMLERSKE